MIDDIGINITINIINIIGDIYDIDIIYDTDIINIIDDIDISNNINISNINIIDDIGINNIDNRWLWENLSLPQIPMPGGRRRHFGTILIRKKIGDLGRQHACLSAPLRPVPPRCRPPPRRLLGSAIRWVCGRWRGRRGEGGIVGAR